MRLNIYATFDSCAKVYGKPFFGRSDGESLRSFSDIAADTQHPIGQHPEHYSLWRLGTFSDQNAEICVETPDCLARAHELINPVKEEAEIIPLSPGGTD